MREGNLLATLRHLCEGSVDFIVVGGMAAVLNGAPVQTLDVDVVYSREPSNIERLLAVLEEMDAIFRMQPERRLRPDKSRLAWGGHLNLLTRFGPLDVHGTIGRGLGFPELLPQSNAMDIGQGMTVRVLNLETIIAVKEQLGAEKDTATLPLLRRTLAEIARQRNR